LNEDVSHVVDPVPEVLVSKGFAAMLPPDDPPHPANVNKDKSRMQENNFFRYLIFNSLPMFKETISTGGHSGYVFRASAPRHLNCRGKPHGELLLAEFDINQGNFSCNNH
jgi:hypothetical protein